MSWYEILALVGVPSILTLILQYFERKSIRKEQAAERERIRQETAEAKKADKSDAVALGVQALLRTQMIDIYETWYKKGHAPIYVRDNFANLFKQYEALGANGVMTDMKDDFFKLKILEDDKHEAEK